MKTVGPEALASLSHTAAADSRLRANLNVHHSLDDPIQRLFNALEPGTYVRPHRHTDPPRWELFLAVHGRAVALTFDDAGTVLERVELAPGGPAVLVEISEGEIHTVAALSPGTVLLELKPGPYRPISDKDFVDWAPGADDPTCERLLHWFCCAAEGQRFPG